MKFHPTPMHIVNVIKRHLPKKVNSLLEPSVGDGALLSAFDDLENIPNLTLVDIDVKRLKSLCIDYEFAEYVHGDFLDWSIENTSRKFDLILTNPPFQSKAEELTEFHGKRKPIEVCFIENCLSHLSGDGTLIAILPDSIINSENWRETRISFFEQGRVTYVYELPEKTFHKIEGVFYLLVFTRKQGSNQICLRDFHDGTNNEIKKKREELGQSNYRLDYSFYKASGFYNVLVSGNANFSGKELRDLAVIKRGRILANYKDPAHMHTTSLGNSAKILASKSRLVSSSYLVVLKRVSRNAHLSFSLINESDAAKCTDCLFLLWPENISSVELLFSLRVLYSNYFGARLLLKGTAAKYISVKDLRGLFVVNLAKAYMKDFSLFEKALLADDYAKCSELEGIVFQKFFYGNNICSIEGISRKNNEVIEQEPQLMRG